MMLAITHLGYDYQGVVLPCIKELRDAGFDAVTSPEMISIYGCGEGDIPAIEAIAAKYQGIVQNKPKHRADAALGGFEEV